MAAYDLEEQEQLANIKAWWEQYGNMVSGLVLFIALGVLGWQGWNWYHNNKTAQAGAAYGSLMVAVDKKDTNAVKQLSAKLMSDFSGSMQSEMAGLIAAKNEVDAKDPKAAQAILKQGIANAKDALIRDVARLHLAALQLDDKAYDEALKTLEATPNEAFVARFADLRGDILFAKGSIDEARIAYKSAMDVLSKQSEDVQQPSMLSLVQIKLEALGGA